MGSERDSEKLVGPDSRFFPRDTIRRYAAKVAIAATAASGVFAAPTLLVVREIRNQGQEAKVALLSKADSIETTASDVKTNVEGMRSDVHTAKDRLEALGPLQEYFEQHLMDQVPTTTLPKAAKQSTASQRSVQSFHEPAQPDIKPEPIEPIFPSLKPEQP